MIKIKLFPCKHVLYYYTLSISASFSYDFTCDPTIGAHVLRVKTFLMNGSLSP